MVAHDYERSSLALAILQHFPPAIRESLCVDHDFLRNLGLTTDTRISFGDNSCWFQRSTLYDRVRELLTNKSAQVTLSDTTEKEWQLKFSEIENEQQLTLSCDQYSFFVSDFLVLSPEQVDRVREFDRKAHDVNLPKEAANKWRTLLASRSLTDDEVDTLHADMKETPIWVAALLGVELQKEASHITTLIPCSRQYFARLVGEYEQSRNILEYAQKGACQQLRHLRSWRDSAGFLYSLLMSLHSSIVALIEVDHLGEQDLTETYAWLQKYGDRISQLGAIELGLSILDKRPKIEPYIQCMIEQIWADNPEDERSRFRLLSALMVLVEGELSRTKILEGTPPFWRRLASIAHASLVEREIIKAYADTTEFTKWATQIRGQFSHLQTMVDLRQEPRWLPEYVAARQLKAEFVGRIAHIAHRNIAKIETPGLKNLLFDTSPDSLLSFCQHLNVFLPGPLEGGIELQIAPPKEIIEQIEIQLNAANLQPDSFVTLVNAATIYRLDPQQTEIAAKALRTVKHNLRRVDSRELLVAVLNGLAAVAAATRSSALANELRILTRRYRHEPGPKLSSEESLRIGLVAAAAHSQLTEWCEFLGEWITELAFQSLERAEIENLLSHTEYLCHIVPQLWRTCGRAEAALRAGGGM
ncbi:MAG: hypothetical protein AB7G75_26645 [Candidatus Binatia bacterium]